MASTTSKLDFDKYRLRNFVDRLIQMGEVEIHDKPVPLTGLSPIIEGTEKAVLFKKAGPEQVEMGAKTGGNRKRLAAAFETGEDKVYDEYFKRLGNPPEIIGAALFLASDASSYTSGSIIRVDGGLTGKV